MFRGKAQTTLNCRNLFRLTWFLPCIDPYHDGKSISGRNCRQTTLTQTIINLISSQYIPYKLLSIDRTDYHTIKTFDFPGLLPLPQTRQISLIIILPTSVMSMSQQGCSKELLARVSNNINTTGQFNGPWGKSVL